MITKHVVVLPYQDSWKDAFMAIKHELSATLHGVVVNIEHVGSTSVEGLSAKPIIDIDIIIERSDFDLVKQRLMSIGYHHEGDLGIIDREAFKYKHKPHLLKHHLYVCPKDSMEYVRHLSFRDWLITHPEDKETYGSLKEELAKKYPYDIDAYMREKAPFIEEIYLKIKKNGS